MVNILLGALGVLIVLGLLALGFFMGWRGHILWRTHTGNAVKEEISEKERLAFEAQQKAFDDLMSYNTETAYGMNASLNDVYGEGGER